jgi:hypothetical protein
VRFSVRSIAVGTGSALALVGVLAACSSSSSTSSAVSASAPAAAAQSGPANPLTIVRKAGATAQPGEVYGSSTAQGWLEGDGSFSASGQPDSNYERVSVYTLPAGITGQQAIAQVGVTSSDSQVLIAGSSFYVFVYPLQNAEGDSVFPVSPATIAARVHGTVVQPSS